MKSKTKHFLKQHVWFMCDNKVVGGEVLCISLQIGHGGSERKSDKMEKDVFATKQDLLNSL